MSTKAPSSTAKANLFNTMRIFFITRSLHRHLSYLNSSISVKGSRNQTQYLGDTRQPTIHWTSTGTAGWNYQGTIAVYSKVSSETCRHLQANIGSSHRQQPAWSVKMVAFAEKFFLPGRISSRRETSWWAIPDWLWSWLRWRRSEEGSRRSNPGDRETGSDQDVKKLRASWRRKEDFPQLENCWSFFIFNPIKLSLFLLDIYHIHFS